MQKAIAMLKEHDLLRVIDEPLDIDLEIPHVAYIEVKNPIPKRFCLPIRSPSA